MDFSIFRGQSMKKILPLVILSIIFFPSIIFTQLSWNSYGDYQLISLFDSYFLHVNKSQDTSKLLIMTSMGEVEDSALYSEIDLETKETVYERTVQYHSPACLMPDSRLLYCKDSLTIACMDLKTDLESFSLNLAPKKEFADSLSGYSQITGVYSWPDNDLFCIAIAGYYRKNDNYSYGLTGNYYIIDKEGNILFESEETGQITDFLPGKDKDHYTISYTSYDYYVDKYGPEQEFHTVIFGDTKKEIDYGFKLQDYCPDNDIMITSKDNSVQFWDMSSQDTVKTRLFYSDAYSIPIINAYFIGKGDLLYLTSNYFNNHKPFNGIFDAENLNSVQQYDMVYNNFKKLDIGQNMFALYTWNKSDIPSQLHLFNPDHIQNSFKAFYNFDYSHVLENSPIQFYNFSTGEPDSVLWDFGDGSTNNEYSPVHIYENPGVYNVTLTAYKNNIPDSYSGEAVTVHKILKPVLSVFPETGTPPFDITVGDESNELSEHEALITIGAGLKKYKDSAFVHSIDSYGEIHAWLVLSDSVFNFFDEVTVRSEFTGIESNLFSLDKIIEGDNESLHIEALLEGNNDKLIICCRHDVIADVYADEELRQFYNVSDIYDMNYKNIDTYYTVHSIEKDFTGLKEIRRFYENIELIKLLNGNYLALLKETNGTVEFDENGDDVAVNTFGKGKYRQMNSIKCGPTGNIFIENSACDLSVYISCFDPTGTLQWEKPVTELVSYLPLNDGGLAISYDEYRYFDMWLTLPIGDITTYDENGNGTGGKTLDYIYSGPESGTSNCSPRLIYEMEDNSIIFIQSYAGTMQPRYVELTSTNGDILKRIGENYMIGDNFFLNDSIWFRNYREANIYNYSGESFESDSLENADFNAFYYDGSYLYCAGSTLASYLPGQSSHNEKKYDAYLAKTKLINNITPVKEDNNLSVAGLNIYPNPGNKQINISFNLNNDLAVQADILDINGNYLTTAFHDFAFAGENTININTETLPTGTYLLRLTAGRNIYTGKFIIER